ncbi:MAG TPA: response regulator [Deltaproteobacteria bacterium]|jgi:two-component system response regulator (stage 0 sporulation protein F)|nr:response regulator [Deltaproteobacteria bacterium]HPJ92819.1 response regulator [Deltaproteobacteria bacterium]HPR50337.1 response regulator [Deltaproteobacteria bacterium]
MSKVLIVDDEKHIRLLYSEELEEEGYEVALASDGSGILDRIKDEKPDVIVLDIKMVSSNGLDVLQEIRNAYYNLPVILCSAYGSYKVDIKSIAADAYVVKSSDLTELKNKIAQVLETRVPEKE